ncbi:hypothetical protein BHECKSOX2_1175 [Bathymodiolus heckerae thiotrophic gill symbiont]|uniref:hypothetical protein n=1 Tax=Bathymodiolus heckerae thiotrophic gill symbiont TaxID=1052212 RepID=UPI0010B07F0E|nr:hypothetical protein [Bathymodiolus heckerae thiotrophic gill symbiont]SMN13945.1 hypothetical protein BHECKSOX2_1175 [Bathymodiolus heckerae thiotrophic gill symbiont]SMN16133.1 hypothetical protein CRYPD_882 [uncultured Candidatus Thioglobus sp.]
MFFKNKHVITSLIVAPILAIMSYFAVDYYVAETPHKAEEGQLYKMLAKPNCRWESGQCDLTNGDLELSITPENKIYGKNNFSLTSSVPLNGVKFALVDKKNGHSLPKSMVLLKSDKTLWQSSQVSVTKSDFIQLVISVNNSVFYAEVPAIFTYKDRGY